jgi:hypothetical protein
MFKVEVIADNSGQWAGNGLTFGTIPEADSYASDLACRWLAVRDWRVLTDVDGKWVPITDDPDRGCIMKLTDHFSVRSEGSLAVIGCKSDLAIDFVEDRVQVPDYMRMGEGLFAVELRYVGPILGGFVEQYEASGFPEVIS